MSIGEKRSYSFPKINKLFTSLQGVSYKHIQSPLEMLTVLRLFGFKLYAS